MAEFPGSRVPNENNSTPSKAPIHHQRTGTWSIFRVNPINLMHPPPGKQTEEKASETFGGRGMARNLLGRLS